ncbi:MAG: type II secretion system F family protein [Roseburia sp.]
MAQKKDKEPQYYLSALNNPVLNYRVYEMKNGEKILYSLLILLIGGAVGLIFYGGMFKDEGSATPATWISNLIVFVLVGAIAVKIFLPSVEERLRKKRVGLLRVQFRDFLSVISSALSSGMNINDAMINAYQNLALQYSEEAYMVTEVKEMLYGLQNNIAIEDSLADFGRRSGIEDVSNFATVFATCYRTGGNLKDIVRRTTSVISEKMMIAEEIETKLTSNKTQMMAMNVIPIIIVFMMRMMSSEFAAGFSSPIGVIAMTIAVAMFVGAYRMGQKIMDIKG